MSKLHRLHGIFEERRNSHRAETSRHGCVGAPANFFAGRIDVADATGMVAGIHHDRLIRNPRSRNEAWLSDSGDQNIRASYDPFEI